MKLNKQNIFVTAACLLLIAPIASAQQKGSIKVKEEVVIHEVCDVIWPYIKNFAEPHKWHPAFASTTAQGGNEVGATRVITLGMGGKIHEKLTKYSSKAMSMSYIITDVDPGVVPVKNYASRLRLEKEGSRCEVDWSVTFDPAGGQPADAVKKAIEGVYRAGLENIKKMSMMK